MTLLGWRRREFRHVITGYDCAKTMHPGGTSSVAGGLSLVTPICLKGMFGMRARGFLLDGEP